MVIWFMIDSIAGLWCRCSGIGKLWAGLDGIVLI